VKHGKHLTQAKAKKILHDKKVRGHPLTPRQRRFMGSRASGQPIKRVKGR